VLIVLYDNPFSPYTRKVRMALAWKGLAWESVDALALAERERLLAVNPRAEVPVLVDDGVVVTDSADIVAYLEDRHPTPPLLPATAERRVKARRWHRLADTVLDAIVHDVSLWTWPTHNRADVPPPGLLEAAQRDLAALFTALEDALDEPPFVCGALSVADLALFPHVSSLRVLGLAADPARFPRIQAWNAAMRAEKVVRDDLDHVRRSMREKFGGSPSPYEGEKVVWRGDRIEWLAHHGFAAWWLEEVRAGRAVVPSSLP
jgi:glutathione S-transferase